MDSMFSDFPILRENNLDFNEGVAYRPKARIVRGEVVIEHCLAGRSFIRDMLENGEAKFCASLFYQVSGEREHYAVDSQENEGGQNDFVKIQKLKKSYSHSRPIVSPCIVAVNDKKIKACGSSGLSDFWKGEFNIPKSARIAVGRKIAFAAGGFRSLMKIEHEKDMPKGSLRVSVNFGAKTGEIPVTLYCAKDVFDALKQMGEEIAPPSGKIDAQETLAYAMVTQALSSFYSQMKEEYKKTQETSDRQTPTAFLTHLAKLKAKSGDDGWEDPEFKPDFAATQMLPYFVSSVRNLEDGND